MNSAVARTDLAQITDDRDLLDAAYGLTERWKAAGIGIEAVEPVLQMMEGHPDWEFGSPGPFVHYVERFYKHGYEVLLVDSLRRRPTLHTLWMLNRVISGEKNADSKRQYIAMLASVARDQAQDAEVRDQAEHFLSLHEG